MAEQSYGDWIRSNPPLPTKRYKKEHMEKMMAICKFCNGSGVLGCLDEYRNCEKCSGTGKNPKNMAQRTEHMTAVEWFANQVEDFLGLLPVDMIEKAKEMEKHQHGQTWDAAIKAHDDRGVVHARSLVDFDEYFNDTFKK